jgi:hypothetical protein
MSAPTLASTSPINLEFSSGQLQVAEEDRVRVAAVAQHALAVSAIGDLNGLGVQFFMDKFLAPLRDWCESYDDRVQQCYVPVTPVGRAMKIYVVRRAAKFDFELNDAIAVLEAQLLFSGWSCDILQIGPTPHEQLQQYFDPEDALRVY